MIRRLIQLILDQSAARRLEREVGRSMGKMARDSESTMTRAFRRIGLAIVAAFSVRALVNFTKEMFRLGSAAGETGSKFQTVFGAERAAELDTFLGKFARLAGLTKTEGREMLANFGAVFQGAGIAADASAELSQRMVELAGDLQSFHDVPIAEAFAAIRSGATGEAEPLKRFGIVLRAVDVDARALRETGKRATSELTEQERVLARLSLITQKAGVAVGDLVRTQDSAANRARRLNAQFRDIRETVAIGVLPALERLLPLFEGLAAKAEAFAIKTGDAVQALMDMAGLTNQIANIEVVGITRALQGMDEAQKQAFLLSRLQRAASEYEGIREEIERIESLTRAEQLYGDPSNSTLRLADLRKELEAAGQVMNAISGMMGAPSAGPAAPVVQDDAAARAQAEAALDLRMAIWDDEEVARQATLEAERQRWEEQVRIWDAEAEALAATEAYKREELEKTKDAAAQVAADMTSAFQSFFEASVLGFEGQGSVWASAAEAARGAGAAIVSGLVAGRAQEQVAAGTAALASGLWPPNPAAIAAGLKHFAAAALYRAIPGVIQGGGGRGSSGPSGAGALPRGALGTSVPGTQQLPPQEINIYLDPLSPADPRFQRASLGAVQQAQEIFGRNMTVNVRPRTGA